MTQGWEGQSERHSIAAKKNRSVIKKNKTVKNQKFEYKGWEVNLIPQESLSGSRNLTWRMYADDGNGEINIDLKILAYNLNMIDWVIAVAKSKLDDRMKENW